MRAHLDDEQPELLDQLSLLYLGIQVALLFLALSLWAARDSDLLADSQAESVWDAAFALPIDRTTPLVPDSKEIVMQRSGCEGWCPVYEVRIRSDGQVRFWGDRFVCAFGERIANVDPYAVRHLIQALEIAHLGQIPSGRSVILDAPTTTLLLVSEHRVKGAVYQDQDNDALIKMGERVDELAGTYRWLPIETATGRECPRTSGTVRFR
jgi:Domain of unknown function (DUF6438)